jgi:hypothetical protein
MSAARKPKQEVLPAEKNPAGHGIKHNPTEETRKQAQQMAAVGITQAQIATYLGISDETFRKYYLEEYNRAKIAAVARVASTLYTRATEKQDLGAAIFYLKAQGGWRETPSPLEGLGNMFNIHIHM